MGDDSLGYDDTPKIPGQDYIVHDGNRPQPPVIDPGTASTQERVGKAPSDAVILFDGGDLSGWEKADGSGPAEWDVENNYMRVVPGTGDIRTKETLGDCQLHVEWASPAEVDGDGQGRGNSGVFLMGRYEIQVLDCYDNPTYPDGQTAGIYGQYPPLVNACRKPGMWETYDIVWIAPRFDGDELASPARVTVFHNGIVVHHDTELNGPTTHRGVSDYEPHAEEEPLKLQDHGDLVRFRNIWYRPLKGYDQQ